MHGQSRPCPKQATRSSADGQVCPSGVFSIPARISMSTTVDLTRQNGVARVTFRTEAGLPLLSSDVRSQIKTALKEIEADSDCRVVVFSSAAKVFLAGADIHELNSLTSRTARKFARDGQRLCQRVADLSAVT